jgi:hypothetical protein
MKKRNEHIGSSLQDFLKEEGVLAPRNTDGRVLYN